MAADNGDLETNEDELDLLMKSYHRAALPDGLLDRCLGTIPQVGPNRLTEHLLDEQRRKRDSRFWTAVALAACVVIAVGLYVPVFFGGFHRSASVRLASRLPAVEGGGYEAQDDMKTANRASYSGLATGPARAQAAESDVADGQPLDNFVGQINPSDERSSTEVNGKVSFEFGVKRESKPNPSGGAAASPAKPSGGALVSGKGLPVKLVPANPNPAKPAAEPRNELNRESGNFRREVGGKEQTIQDYAAKANRAVEGRRQSDVRDQQKDHDDLAHDSRQYREDLEKFAAREKLALDEAKHRRDEVNRLRQQLAAPNTEAYDRIIDNPFVAVEKDPLSTFSIDVDTASYSNMRRFITQGMLPPKDSVRIEELINYFSYSYPQPDGEQPFSVNVEVAGCPWNADHRLVRIGLKGREISEERRPPANLVFLVDVSGSMQPANRLPLLKSGLKMLVEKLTGEDRVAIVVYASDCRVWLPTTYCDNKRKILDSIDQLQAGGSTNGGAGIQLAYEQAVAGFIPGGINRVILGTDGDFNVGVTDPNDLVRMIEEKAKTKVFLSVLGFGMGNLKDSTMEKLADKGNGHYAYIDTIDEAKKVLVDQMSGTLITIAKDVKIQIEFNPAQVAAYRQIGYENRVLRHQDFNDDRKDAGEIGAGHTVTALYEVVPVGTPIGLPGIDPLKYQKPPRPRDAAAATGELLTVKLRYKAPEGDTSKLIEHAVTDIGRRFGESSTDFKFAASVAAFGMLLRDSEHKGTATLDGVLEIADAARGTDLHGYRAEFVKLVRRAKEICGR